MLEERDRICGFLVEHEVSCPNLARRFVPLDGSMDLTGASLAALSAPSLPAATELLFGEDTGTSRLLHDVFKEVWSQPLLDRRSRAKPHELKGTPAFARAVASSPPGRITLKIATRRPQVLEA
ncbi:hypothetical protein ACWD4L_34365 [Streptomyces sp. NPDC002596]